MFISFIGTYAYKLNISIAFLPSQYNYMSVLGQCVYNTMVHLYTNAIPNPM